MVTHSLHPRKHQGTGVPRLATVPRRLASTSCFRARVSNNMKLVTKAIQARQWETGAVREGKGNPTKPTDRCVLWDLRARRPGGHTESDPQPGHSGFGQALTHICLYHWLLQGYVYSSKIQGAPWGFMACCFSGTSGTPCSEPGPGLGSSCQSLSIPGPPRWYQAIGCIRARVCRV